LLLDKGLHGPAAMGRKTIPKSGSVRLIRSKGPGTHRPSLSR
jgi:hypothetical protein